MPIYPVSVTELICSGECGELKPASAFSPAKRNRSGLLGVCRACVAKQKLKRHGDDYPLHRIEGRRLSRKKEAALIAGLTGGTDCIIWPGGRGRGGYGQISIRNAPSRIVHRYLWLVSGREIPDGMVLDHICHDPLICRLSEKCPHRACINLDHLMCVTQADNSRRSTNLIKTHCKRGHPWIEENIDTVSGNRRCILCRKIRHKEREDERKDERTDEEKERLRLDRNEKAVVRYHNKQKSEGTPSERR